MMYGNISELLQKLIDSISLEVETNVYNSIYKGVMNQDSAKG